MKKKKLKEKLRVERRLRKDIDSDYQHLLAKHAALIDRDFSLVSVTNTGENIFSFVYSVRMEYRVLFSEYILGFLGEFANSPFLNITFEPVRVHVVSDFQGIELFEVDIDLEDDSDLDGFGELLLLVFRGLLYANWH